MFTLRMELLSISKLNWQEVGGLNAASVGSKGQL